ncbi:FAD-dependent oxidoreductase [Halobacillus halophilus]|uniref:FAD-dependent oxidoreductase n=1 Tax=Halobacillus halophilus TaxID=1570 RepID=UPI001CD2637A|nr:FAD-dependent oxidoreductase [Halobacillus halophilus]MCA1011905.1 FAD-dependent oxidoreductase [Halobacillus halophilus]
MANQLPERSFPLWRHQSIGSFPALTENTEADVTVIGSGITGIMTAYLLVKKGFRVVILEAGKIVEGTTGYTTAKISSQHGLIYDHLIQTFGKEKAKLYYDANQEALQLMDQIRQEHHIDCDFAYQDAYVYSTTVESKRNIEKEAKAYEQLGIDGELSQHTDLPFPVTASIKMKDQAHFNPVKFLLPLIEYLRENGTSIYEDTRAVDIKEGKRPEVITRNGQRVHSDHVVMASHFPFKDFKGLYFARLHVDRSYSLAVKMTGQLPDGMYLNAESPKRSLRHAIDSNGDRYLLIGGEGHPSGQSRNTEQHYKRLRDYAEQHFDVESVPYRWSSQDMTTLDMVPYIGPITEKHFNIHVATGFAKWGMTNGTAAAMVITDLISQDHSPYAELFNPSRFHAQEDVKSFTKENANVAKEFVKGKLSKGDRTIDDLIPDEGAIINIDGKKAGAYKTDDGTMKIVDTTCTHMGCDLEWNNGERSWDCPCHGSRFTPDGEVIEGPATEPLKKLSKE